MARIITTVSILPEHDNWLKEHYISPTLFIRKKIEEEMKKVKQ